MGEKGFSQGHGAFGMQLFEGEAAGLVALRGAKAFRIPEVVGMGFSKVIGLGLAMEGWKPHRSSTWRRPVSWKSPSAQDPGTERHGFDGDNHIEQHLKSNTQERDWVDFLREASLRSLAESELTKDFLSGVDQLMLGATSFFRGQEGGSQPSATETYGAAMSGLRDGGVAIFDPAVMMVTECDLAMTELFGGFSPEFYEQYQQHTPIHPGYAHRKRIYQLYHLLNHFHLFGGSYGTQAQSLIHHLNEVTSSI